MKTRHLHLISLMILLLCSCKRELNLGEVNTQSGFTIRGIANKIAVYPSTVTEDSIRTQIYSAAGNELQDDKGFTYTWCLLNQLYKGNTSFIRFDTLSQYAYLTHRMVSAWKEKSAANFGEYTVQVTATEKNTGIFCTKIFTLNVSKLIDEGWMLLCNKEGKNQLGWLAYNRSEDSTYYTVTKDLQKRVPDIFQPSGTAISLAGQKDAIFMTTSTGIYALDKDRLQETLKAPLKSIQKVLPPSNMFRLWNIFNEMCVVSSGNELFRLDIYHETIYKINQSRPTSATPPALAYPFTGQLTAFYETEYSDGSVLSFNSLTGRFMTTGPFKWAGGLDTATAQNLDLVGSPDLGNSILLHLAKGARNIVDEYTAVFYQPATATSKVITFLPNGIIRRVREIKQVDLGKSQHFAVHPQSGNLIYAVGNCLYSYNIFAPQESHALLVDFGEKQIKKIKFNQIAFNLQTSRRRPLAAIIDPQLAVTSWDPAKPQDGGGFHLFTLPSANQPAIEQYQAKGFPPIVDFCFMYK